MVFVLFLLFLGIHIGAPSQAVLATGQTVHISPAPAPPMFLPAPAPAPVQPVPTQSASAQPQQPQARAASATRQPIHVQSAWTQPPQPQAQAALVVVPPGRETRARSSLRRAAEAAAAAETSQLIVPHSGQPTSQELEPYNEPPGVESPSNQSPSNQNLDSVMADMQATVREGESLVEAGSGAEDKDEPMDIDRKNKRKRLSKPK